MQPMRLLGTRLSRSGLLALSLAGYVLLALLFPLLPNYNLRPVADFRTFLPGLWGGVLYLGLMLALYLLYALLLFSLEREASWSLQHLSAAAAVLAVPLVFVYPINANDLFRYVIRGIIHGRLGQNPYVYAPADTGDPLLMELAGEWRGATSPYGPLWEQIASLITSIAQGNLLLSLILFKVLGLLSLLAAALILWRLFAHYTDPDSEEKTRILVFAAVWALNPALLMSFVVNGHNDAVMILCLLAGWYVMVVWREGPGFLIMYAAVLVKPIALLALPITFVAAWCRLEQGRDRARFLLWVVTGSVIMTWAAFLPFGSPQALLLRLLREASAGGAFSPVTLLILIARKFGWTDSYRLFTMLATAVFAVFFLWLLWRTWRRNRAEENVAFAFWGYIFQALNFRIWYAAWPFPWLLLNAYRGERRALYWLHGSLWFLLTTQLSVVLYGHFRTAFMGGDHFWAHLIGVPFVFMLPLFLASISTRYLRKPRQRSSTSIAP